MEKMAQNNLEGEPLVCVNCCKSLSATLNEGPCHDTEMDMDNKFVSEIRLSVLPTTTTTNTPIEDQLESTSSEQGNSRTIKVEETLSLIYNLNCLNSSKNKYLVGDERRTRQNVDDGLNLNVICSNCALVLTELARFYDEFNKLRKCESVLAQKIMELENLILCSTNETEMVLSSSKKFPVFPSPRVQLCKLTTEQILKATVRKVEQDNSDLTWKTDDTLKTDLNSDDNNSVNFSDHDDEYILPDTESGVDDATSAYDSDDYTKELTRMNLFTQTKLSTTDQAVKTRSKSKSGKSNSKCLRMDQLRHSSSMRSKRNKVKSNYLKCTYCSKVFKTGWDLKTHTRVHTKERPYHCAECPATFTQSSALHLHIRKIHQNPNRERKRKLKNPSESQNEQQANPFIDASLVCTYCSKVFKKAWDLKTHTRVHTKERPYHCAECPATFTQSSPLHVHIRKVHQDPSQHPVQSSKKSDNPSQFLCWVCGAAYKAKSFLERHMVYHRDERNFPCKECGKSFKASKDLKKHQQIHAPIKAFLCSQCGKSFAQSHVLKVHLQVHTGEKPYKCKLCNEAFSFNKPLKSHLVNVHGESFLYLAGRFKKQMTTMIQDPSPEVVPVNERPQ